MRWSLILSTIKFSPCPLTSHYFIRAHSVLIISSPLPNLNFSLIMIFSLLYHSSRTPWVFWWRLSKWFFNKSQLNFEGDLQLPPFLSLTSVVPCKMFSGDQLSIWKWNNLSAINHRYCRTLLLDWKMKVWKKKSTPLTDWLLLTF